MLNKVVVLTLAAACQMVAAEIVDPTRPIVYTESAVRGTGNLRLESVLFSGNRQVAIVNGRVVGVGDRVGDAKVVRIHPGGVAVRQAGETWLLTLPNARVKTASTKK